ncbi:MAG: transposase [Gammaproteobacteria bacterium]|nr:transposase [Gammaproteobacteria bacterium]
MYQLVEQHYPTFRELRAQAGKSLPDYVQEEFDAYLKCGRLEEGFLRVRCEQCHAEKLVAFSCKKRGFCPSCCARRMAETAALLADEVLPERPLRQWVLSLPHALRFLLATDPEALTLVLGVVYRTISRHLLHKAGLKHSSGATGAVTLVQRFGSALNLNVHFHMLFLDGVYVAAGPGQPLFRHVVGPGQSELQALVEQIASRIGRVLERRGLVERDIESAWLAGDGEGGPLDDLLDSSITYRIAVGPRAGQKLFTLQTVPPRLQGLEGDPNGAARAGGFSLHAGIDIAPDQRPKLERLCRYVSRPPVATERMAMTSSGHVRYQLKTPYRDGTTHIVLEPLDFMARLAALVPPPKMHLTRYHGVFAPHSKLRAAVTAAHRGIGAPQPLPAADPAKPPTPRHVAMTWARRLKRVFGIEIEACVRCGGKLAIIASIEEPEVIASILAHLETAAPDQFQAELPRGARAPPSQPRLL